MSEHAVDAPEPEERGDDLSRAEFAYRRLLNDIRSGELRPGQRMREAELAGRLHMSRTPIREAIRRLSSDGLVAMAPSRGMVVTELDKQQVRELYFVRGTLEGAAARLAAQHSSLGEIATLRDLLRTSSSVHTSEQTARLNTLFHNGIHEAAHNRYLTRSLVQLADYLALLPGTTFEIAGRREAALREHGEILQAIEQRQPEQAEALARHHIELAGLTRLRMMFR